MFFLNITIPVVLFHPRPPEPPETRSAGPDRVQTGSNGPFVNALIVGRGESRDTWQEVRLFHVRTRTARPRGEKRFAGVQKKSHHRGAPCFQEAPSMGGALEKEKKTPTLNTPGVTFDRVMSDSFPECRGRPLNVCLSVVGEGEGATPVSLSLVRGHAGVSLCGQGPPRPGVPRASLFSEPSVELWLCSLSVSSRSEQRSSLEAAEGAGEGAEDEDEDEAGVDERGDSSPPCQPPPPEASVIRSISTSCRWSSFSGMHSRSTSSTFFTVISSTSAFSILE
ncbi:hypothetical protein EYF80_046235 [Liparis tanakae]|uniref:Uncharacterized protein n=1 Tax=Liparis tanakae TaxID=230148 RepID=A0A4Z2FT53_9TELE|nr:hypothetical protein EYF80_046235 [Liparis tanakae]